MIIVPFSNFNNGSGVKLSAQLLRENIAIAKSLSMSLQKSSYDFEPAIALLMPNKNINDKECAYRQIKICLVEKDDNDDNDLKLFWREKDDDDNLTAFHFISKKEFIEGENSNLNEISYRFKANELQRRMIYPSHSEFNVKTVFENYKTGDDTDTTKIWSDNQEEDYNTVVPNIKNLSFDFQDAGFITTDNHPIFLHVSISLLPEEVFKL